MEAMYFDSDVRYSDGEDEYIDGRLVVEVYILKYLLMYGKIYKTKALETDNPKIVELLYHGQRSKKFLKRPLWFFTLDKAIGYANHYIKKEIKNTKRKLDRLTKLQCENFDIKEVDDICGLHLKKEELEDLTLQPKYRLTD